MTLRSFRYLLLPLCVLLGTACSSRQLARTMGEGNGEVRVSAGGPFFSNVGSTIPLPNVAIGGRYGVADGWDVDANVSMLAAAMGVAYVDPGVVRQLYAVDGGPAVSASARANLFVGNSDGLAVRVYPEIGLHGELPLGRHANVFAGGTAWVNFTPSVGKSPVMVTPYLGASWRFSPQRLGGPELSLQMGWVSPWEDSTSVVEWQPMPHGALSAVIGLSIPFGGAR